MIQKHEEKDQLEAMFYKYQCFSSKMLKGDHSVSFSVSCFNKTKGSRIVIDVV